jgi:hypothetical protein
MLGGVLGFDVPGANNTGTWPSRLGEVSKTETIKYDRDSDLRKAVLAMPGKN